MMVHEKRGQMGQLIIQREGSDKYLWMWQLIKYRVSQNNKGVQGGSKGDIEKEFYELEKARFKLF